MPRAWAFSATLRSVSTPCLNSSSVGPCPEKTPMAEWIGPQRISQPNASPRSSTLSSCATAASRITGSGEIGLASGVMTVTAVAPRPSDRSRLPSLS